MSDKHNKIYYNGNFHTMNEALPSATSVACRDGKIIAVGNYTEFDDLAEDAEMIDLDGKFVFPGFIDTHSAAAIEAFNKASSTDEDFAEADAVQWVKDSMGFLSDKGTARLCLHGSGDRFKSTLDKLAEKPDAPQILTETAYCSPFEEDVSDDYYDDILRDPDSSLLLFIPIFDDYTTVHESMENLTVLAAKNIGRDSDLGTIEPGKIADFTVFDENPFAANMRTFSRMHASMVIIDGETAYDADLQASSELFDMLLGQAF